MFRNWPTLLWVAIGLVETNSLFAERLSESPNSWNNTLRGSITADVADLQDQLEAGLQARRPQEFAFIARVVAMVSSNRLPRSLVQSTFQWARRKQPYPFPYFQRALIIRAARIGIRVADHQGRWFVSTQTSHLYDAGSDYSDRHGTNDGHESS